MTVTDAEPTLGLRRRFSTPGVDPYDTVQWGRRDAVIIDHVGDDPSWRTHHTPMLYGFESYVSIPITLNDGRFFGTLCAIDPQPRALSAPATISRMKRLALAVADILSSSPAAQLGLLQAG